MANTPITSPDIVNGTSIEIEPWENEKALADVTREVVSMNVFSQEELQEIVNNKQWIVDAIEKKYNLEFHGIADFFDFVISFEDSKLLENKTWPWEFIFTAMSTFSQIKLDVWDCSSTPEERKEIVKKIVQAFNDFDLSSVSPLSSEKRLALWFLEIIEHWNTDKF